MKLGVEVGLARASSDGARRLDKDQATPLLMEVGNTMHERWGRSKGISHGHIALK